MNRLQWVARFFLAGGLFVLGTVLVAPSPSLVAEELASPSALLAAAWLGIVLLEIGVVVWTFRESRLRGCSPRTSSALRPALEIACLSLPLLFVFFRLTRVSFRLWHVFWLPPLTALAATITINLVTDVPENARRTDADSTRRAPARWNFASATGIALPLAILALYALGHPSFEHHLSKSGQLFLYDVKRPHLSKWETSRLQRNYYERLVRSGWFTSQALDAQIRPCYYDDLIEHTSAAEATGDFLKLRLLPEKQALFLGQSFTTNRWGMRDKDYTKAKPPDTFRIAVLGPSHTMGLGVADGETFADLLERRLNQSASQPGDRKYEVLNFGCSDYTVLHYALMLEDRVLPFAPDAVFVIGHMDQRWAIEHLADRVVAHASIPSPFLRNLLRRAGIESDMRSREIERRLKPFASELLRWAYGRITETCRRHKITAYWIFLPLVGSPHVKSAGPDAKDVVFKLAKQAGFRIIDLSNIWRGVDESKFKVAVWDAHPNAAGHERIANRMYEELSPILEASETATAGEPRHRN